MFLISLQISWTQWKPHVLPDSKEVFVVKLSENDSLAVKGSLLKPEDVQNIFFFPLGFGVKRNR